MKGLSEVQHEGYKESEQIVRAFFSTHPELQVGDIEHAQRIVQGGPDAQCPIIVKAKTEALRNASQLKNLEWPK